MYWKAVLGRRKAVVALALYWLTLFVLTHIPVPQVMRNARMSDKSLHFLGYLILTFLLWSAVRPGEKVRWHRATVWWMLALLAVYGICDEVLQYFVAGRSMDLMDFLADMIGAAAALGLLTVLSFWPASLIVAGTTIYTLAVFTRANLTSLLPVTMTAFHLVTHAVFTFLWMGYLGRRLSPRRSVLAWTAASVSAPTALVLVTRVSAMLSGKAFESRALVAAGAGILGAVTVTSAMRLLGRKPASRAMVPPPDHRIAPARESL
jgi:VanZ family protein